MTHPLPSRLRLLAMALLLVAAGTIGALPRYGTARSLPDWEVHVIMALGLVVVLLLGRLLWHDLPKEGEYTKRVAEKIAKERWYCKGMSVWEGDKVHVLGPNGWCEEVLTEPIPPEDVGTVVLHLVSAGIRRQPCTIPFRPKHPSVEAIKRLRYLDEVEFYFTPYRFPCGMITDLCTCIGLRLPMPEPAEGP